ncbi:PAS domain S-box protein [bacterium]|nr:PAS domain S-box protein [bacterium]MBU1990450.1 PAS domain S-box protein [bacterium]
MNKLITFLSRHGFWPFVIVLTLISVLFAQILMMVQSYWTGGSFFDEKLVIAGLVIPATEAFIFFVFTAFLIKYLQELQEGKYKILVSQNKTKEKLRLEEERARQYLDITGTLIVALDLRGNIMLANKELCRALGYESENMLVGQNWFEIYLPEDVRDAVYKTFQEIVAGKIQAHQTYENELLFKDGSVRFIEWNNEYIKDENDEIRGVLCSGRDTTESKKAQEELHLVKYALDNIDDAIYLSDEHGHIQYISNASVRQLGYTREEILTMGIYDIDPNYKKEENPRHWKEIQEKGSSIFTTTHKHKNGTIFPVEINANYVEYYGRGFILALVRDITQRKKSQDRLKLLASVFTYALEGIIITDTNNTIVDVNEAFVQITGYSRAEVLGKNPNILQSGRNDENFYNDLWDHLQNDAFWQGELWNKSKDGREYAENLTISAVYDEKNVVQNYVAIFTDITLQKQQQERLEHIAHYDALTGLPNRVLFSDRMHQAMTQTLRRGQQIAVVYIDLDGFKNVNDSFGHDAGDELLIVLAKDMSYLLRQGDTLSRIGGDEFVALLIDIPGKASIDSFLMRMLETVSKPIQIHEFCVNVSASIGVTFYPQKTDLDADQIIRQADQAMYQAKLSGKNKYVVFDTQHPERSEPLTALEKSAKSF